MTDDNSVMSQILDQMEALVAGVGAVLESQQTLIAKIDAQTQSLSAIADAIGMTYIATGSERPLPPAVLEDQAFNRFLDDYPLDGPPIVGKEAMEDHLARLAEVDPRHLAAGFRSSAFATCRSSASPAKSMAISRRWNGQTGRSGERRSYRPFSSSRSICSISSSKASNTAARSRDAGRGAASFDGRPRLGVAKPNSTARSTVRNCRHERRLVISCRSPAPVARSRSLDAPAMERSSFFETDCGDSNG